MLSRVDSRDTADDRVALKDDRLVYRACSMAYARSLGVASPDEIVGKTDFDLFPRAVAREQMALDSRAIHSGQSDIGTLPLSARAGEGIGRAMIVRTPLMTPSRDVKGIDIRLLGGPLVDDSTPEEAVDYRTLVSNAIQGSLIFAGDEILFANENAARVLGYPGAALLVDEGSVSEVFSTDERARIANALRRIREAELEERRVNARLTLTASTRFDEQVRLIARGTPVQWGALSATLLSFVDVALPDRRRRPLTDRLFTARAMPPVATVAPASARRQLASSRKDLAGSAESNVVVTEQLTAADRLKQLRASEQRFRHYARAGADFFWEIDGALMFRSVSAEIETVFGVPREHLIGRTHRQLADHPASADEASHWETHLDNIDAHRPFRDFEFRWNVAGETRVIRYSGLPVFDRERRFLGYRGVGGDVTKAVRQAETTAYHANHDALTGLVNRRHFESKVSRALESSRKRREAHALFFMDLDSFKIVNDTCGHKAGDELLRQLANLFDSLVRKSDVLARVGGDEFAVFLYKCDVAGALKLANQIRSEVENFEFLWEGKRFTVGVSIGLVVVDDRWEKLESLFSAADSACYIAKNEGRNRVIVYREGEGNASNRKVATHWVEEIDAALAGDRVQLAFQKIVPMRGNNRELRYEMLLRLRLSNGDIASPRAFLPAAERYGLSPALDERAIDMTLKWLARHPSLESIRQVSINLAAGSFTDDGFKTRLLDRLAESKTSASLLCFEITETSTIANLAKATSFMQELSAVGCRFTIDDFGSGLSSFAWLRELPIDFLKIDGRLVRDILDDAIDFTTVRAINEISRSMGTRTVAQHVESARLFNAVRNIGIDFAQGFHIAEPVLIPAVKSQ